MKVKLYFKGISKNPDGTEAEFVEIDEDQEFALFALGWKRSPETSLPE